MRRRAGRPGHRGGQLRLVSMRSRWRSSADAVNSCGRLELLPGVLGVRLRRVSATSVAAAACGGGRALAVVTELAVLLLQGRDGSRRVRSAARPRRAGPRRAAISSSSRPAGRPRRAARSRIARRRPPLRARARSRSRWSVVLRPAVAVPLDAALQLLDPAVELVPLGAAGRLGLLQTAICSQSSPIVSSRSASSAVSSADPLRRRRCGLVSVGVVGDAEVGRFVLRNEARLRGGRSPPEAGRSCRCQPAFASVVSSVVVGHCSSPSSPRSTAWSVMAARRINRRRPARPHEQVVDGRSKVRPRRRAGAGCRPAPSRRAGRAPPRRRGWRCRRTGSSRPVLPAGLEERLDAGSVQGDHHQVEPFRRSRSCAPTVADELELAALAFRAQRRLEQSGGLGVVVEDQDRGAARLPGARTRPASSRPRATSAAIRVAGRPARRRPPGRASRRTANATFSSRRSAPPGRGCPREGSAGRTIRGPTAPASVVGSHEPDPSTARAGRLSWSGNAWNIGGRAASRLEHELPGPGGQRPVGQHGRLGRSRARSRRGSARLRSSIRTRPRHRRVDPLAERRGQQGGRGRPARRPGRRRGGRARSSARRPPGSGRRTRRSGCGPCPAPGSAGRRAGGCSGSRAPDGAGRRTSAPPAARPGPLRRSRASRSRSSGPGRPSRRPARALATPVLSRSGVNGLGIWSTTFGNSVYAAKARLRIAELMTTGICAVSSGVEETAGRPRRRWSRGAGGPAGSGRAGAPRPPRRPPRRSGRSRPGSRPGRGGTRPSSGWSGCRR